MKKLLLFVALYTLLFSCSPVKQLNRLRVNNPELFQSEKIIDTVVIPETIFDTTFRFSEPKISILSKLPQQIIDTFILKKQTGYGHKKDFSLRIVGNRDSIKVSGEIPRDTIYKPIEIEKYKTCTRKHFEDFVKAGTWIGIGVLAIFFILFILVFIKRNFI